MSVQGRARSAGRHLQEKSETGLTGIELKHFGIGILPLKAHLYKDIVRVRVLTTNHYQDKPQGGWEVGSDFDTSFLGTDLRVREGHVIDSSFSLWTRID